MGRIAREHEINEADVEVERPKRAAAGVEAVSVALSRAVKAMGLVRTGRSLPRLNQVDGFDCQGCGWPDPLPCRGLTLVSEGRACPRVPDWQLVYRMEGLRLSFGVRCSACAGPAFGVFGIGFEREGDQSR